MTPQISQFHNAKNLFNRLQPWRRKAKQRGSGRRLGTSWRWRGSWAALTWPTADGRGFGQQGAKDNRVGSGPLNREECLAAGSARWPTAEGRKKVLVEYIRRHVAAGGSNQAGEMIDGLCRRYAEEEAQQEESEGAQDGAIGPDPFSATDMAE